MTRSTPRRVAVLGILAVATLGLAAAAQVGPPPLPPLPPPPVPAGNPVTASKANLGKVLFWDEQMSSTRTTACGSCHQGARGGSDARSVAGSTAALNPGKDGIAGTPDDVLGSPGVPLADGAGRYVGSAFYGLTPQVTTRLANAHVNSAYPPELFWDGRARGTFVDPVSGATVLPVGGALESQVLAPPVSSVEMGHMGRDWPQVAARIAASQPLALAAFVPTVLGDWIGGRDYPALFAEAFGTSDVTPARIALAIATYERTLVANQTPFDSANAGLTLLRPDEAAGRGLFGALGCAGCHAGPLVSDNLYHYIGVRPAGEDSGRAAVTLQPGDLGAMKTPSLRNVALRPAYMHDGRFHTLAEVIDFYDRGGDFNAPNKPPVIRPLGLTALQKSQLLAFLSRPLTDPRVAAEQAPFDRPSLSAGSALSPAVEGAGVAGSGGFVPQPVALEPPLLGNSDFTLALSGALGGASALLVVDDAPPPPAAAPGSASLARVAVTLDGAGAGGGHASLDVAIPADAAAVGRVYYARWYVDDPGAPGALASSALVRFQVFGPHATGVLAAGGPPSLSALVALNPSAPNPFRGARTTLSFDLLVAGDVRLTVYDGQGRRVRQLVDARGLLAGTHHAVWDGRDDQGRTLAAGVYFARLETDRGARSQRLVKLD